MAIGILGQKTNAVGATAGLSAPLELVPDNLGGTYPLAIPIDTLIGTDVDGWLDAGANAFVAPYAGRFLAEAQVAGRDNADDGAALALSLSWLVNGVAVATSHDTATLPTEADLATADAAGYLYRRLGAVLEIAEGDVVTLEVTYFTSDDSHGDNFTIDDDPAVTWASILAYRSRGQDLIPAVTAPATTAADVALDPPVGPYSDVQAFAEGAWSGAAVGRPKLLDGSTFYGVPFVTASDWGWVSKMARSADIVGKIRYTPLPILAPIRVTGLEVSVERVPIDENDVQIEAHLRLVMVPADTDWQPVGDPIFQEIITVPSDAVPVVEIELDGLDHLVPAGFYLVGVESDQVETQHDFIELQEQPAAFLGSSICATTGGVMIQYLTAPHVYGTLADPLPVPTVAVSTDAVQEGENMPLYPFFFEWEPA